MTEISNGRVHRSQFTLHRVVQIRFITVQCFERKGAILKWKVLGESEVYAECNEALILTWFVLKTTGMPLHGPFQQHQFGTMTPLHWTRTLIFMDKKNLYWIDRIEQSTKKRDEHSEGQIITCICKVHLSRHILCESGRSAPVWALHCAEIRFFLLLFSTSIASNSLVYCTNREKKLVEKRQKERARKKIGPPY